MELELDDRADGCLDRVGEVFERAVGVGDGDDLDDELPWWSHRRSSGGCCYLRSDSGDSRGGSTPVIPTARAGARAIAAAS